MQQNLIDAFRFHRLRRSSAKAALVLARKDVEAGKIRYPSTPGGMWGGQAFKAYGEERMTWFERPGDYMRRVGTCSEIWKREGNRYARDIHNGWYLSDDQSETVEGVVYQLPSRGSKLQFLYGYADPHNEGAACLSLDIVDDLKDATTWADSVAEKMAEQEREYQEAWQAGRRFEELGEQISNARKSCLELIRETKEACKSITDMPAIRRTIRSAIEDYRDEISARRKERKELESNYGRADGFVE